MEYYILKYKNNMDRNNKLDNQQWQNVAYEEYFEIDGVEIEI